MNSLEDELKNSGLDDREYVIIKDGGSMFNLSVNYILNHRDTEDLRKRECIKLANRMYFMFDEEKENWFYSNKKGYFKSTLSKVKNAIKIPFDIDVDENNKNVECYLIDEVN